MTVKQLIGKRIREARIAKALRMEAVAAPMSISFSTVYNWERGKAGVPSHRLPELASILSVDIGYFFRPFRSDDRVGQ